MDHARKPRNFGDPGHAGVTVRAENPMCGDDITVYLDADGGEKVGGVRFSGNACSICVASASLMTLKTGGKAFDEVDRLSKAFQSMVTGADAAGEDVADMGDLRALEGVRQFPMRVKCATLPWHALDDALAAARKGETEGHVRVDT